MTHKDIHINTDTHIHTYTHTNTQGQKHISQQTQHMFSQAKNETTKKKLYTCAFIHSDKNKNFLTKQIKYTHTHKETHG